MHLKNKFHCRTENGKLRLFIHPATYFNKNIMHASIRFKIQVGDMVLLSTDGYALCLLAFFATLDGYAQLKRPERPPAPDPRDGDETLQNSRSAAYEQAIERWKIEYLQPWLQRKERHDKQKRAERRKTLRKRTSEAAAVGDLTAMQRQDSERDRKKKSNQSSRKRTSEAAATGDATAMQRQQNSRKRTHLIRFSSASHPLLIRISSASSSLLSE